MNGMRVVFDFDEATLQELRQATHDAGLPNWAATIRSALHLMRTMQGEADRGGTHVVIHNRSTGGHRRIDVKQLLMRTSPAA